MLDEDTISAMLQYIRAAVNRVEQLTNLPLLDANYVYDLCYDNTEDPICIGRAIEPFRVNSIQYWSRYAPGYLRK